MEERTILYKGTLDRFGYDITCIHTDKEKCENIILIAYIRAFKLANDGLHPKESFSRDTWSFMSDYDVAKSDIEWEQFELGVPVWC